MLYSVKKIARFVCLFFCCGVIFFGCKSAPKPNPVNPLDLLDGNSAIYFAIPTQVDTELVKNILKNNVKGLSESDAKAVIERIDMIYAGISYSKKGVDLQGAVSCNIPTAYHSNIFSKKNGWTTLQYSSSGTSRVFNLYENSDLTISLPDANTLCLGRDVTKMIDTYDFLSTPIPYGDVAQSNDGLNESFYNHLNDAKSEIKFVAQNPQRFIAMLTGVEIDLKLDSIMGEMKSDPKKDSQYIIDLEFNFQNERYVKPGKALLSLAFGLTDIDVSISSNALKVTGLRFSKKQIYDLLTFN